MRAETFPGRGRMEGSMKCIDCGATMETGKENYRYDDSGLPYVVLVNVEVSRCAKCGAVEVKIPAIEPLHRAIAWSVARKDSRLTPEETRFLRKYLGFSTGDLAEIVGIDPATVSRWENGTRPIGPTTDRLLRMMVATRSPACEYPINNLRHIDKERANPVRVELKKVQDDCWETVEA